jgi:hypothetical protein
VNGLAVHWGIHYSERALYLMVYLESLLNKLKKNKNIEMFFEVSGIFQRIYQSIG